MNKQANELKHIVEAAILVSDDPISIKRIISLFPTGAKPGKHDVLATIEELSDECEQRGIELKKVGGGYRFQSKQRYAEFLRKLYETKPPRYSRAALETLSVIAYRQPVTRGDIEQVRGVSVSTDIMRTLLNRHWVKEVGYKDVPGRPALYATTKEFLAYFNLKSIREMPELHARRELEEIARDHQITLPLDEPASQPVPAEVSGIGDVVSDTRLSTAMQTNSDQNIDDGGEAQIERHNALDNDKPAVLEDIQRLKKVNA